MKAMKNSLRKLGKRHRRGKAEVPRDPPRLHTSTPSEDDIATPPFGKEKVKKKERQEQSSVQLAQGERQKETTNEERVEDGQEKLQEGETEKRGGGGRQDTAEEEGNGNVKRQEVKRQEEGEEESPKAENGGCRELEEDATEEKGKGREHPEEDAEDGSEHQQESLDEVNKHVVRCHPLALHDASVHLCLVMFLPRDYSRIASPSYTSMAKSA